MKLHLLLLAGTILTISQNASAQKDSTIYQPAQVSFVYPMGTDGRSSINQRYGFSINIIGGANGGVNGFECASIYNVNNGDVYGAQFAGIMNRTDGKHQGGKFAGIMNSTTEQMQGAQFAGIMNTAKSLQGVQASTINFSKDYVVGAQLGLINVTKNVGADKNSGAQVGLINVTGKINGAQVGLINISDNINGCKVGLVNIADSINGVAIGLINIAKNGYYAVEASTNELLLHSLSFKMGSNNFYSIIKGGFTTFKTKDVFAVGFGVGTMSNFHSKHQIQAELVSSNLIYDNEWNCDDINLLSTISLNYRYNFNKTISVTAGPTFNSYTSNTIVDGKFGVIDIPNTVYERVHRHKHQIDDEEYSIGLHQHSFWFGANVGVTIAL